MLVCALPCRVLACRRSKPQGAEMPATTVASIDTIHLRIPLDIWAPPPLFAGRPRSHVEMLLVRVATNGGVVGWGECFGTSSPLIPVIYDSWLRHLVVGQEATDTELT